MKLNELFASDKSRFGKGNIMGFGRQCLALPKTIVDLPRLPFGVFPLDYATAGGLPLNTPTSFTGTPNSGKSTALILLMRNLAKVCMNLDCLKPLPLCTCRIKKDKQKSFLLHTEGMMPDSTWHKTLGYDFENELVVGMPEYGEMGCEMIEAALKMDDCGLVVVDSLNQLIPKDELECDYLDAKVAQQARLFSRLFRRLSPILVNEFRRGHVVGLVFVNQVRSIIGAGKFDPQESMSGGWAHRHAYRLVGRFSQLAPDKAGGEVDTTDNVKKVLKFSLSMLGAMSKQQLLMLAGKCEFRLAVRDFKGWSAGQVLDSTSCITKANELGLITKSSLGTKKLQLKGIKMGWAKGSDIEATFQSDDYEGMQGASDIFRYIVVQEAKNRLIQEIEHNQRLRILRRPVVPSVLEESDDA